MKRLYGLTLLAALLAWNAYGQGGTEGYSKMSFSADLLTGNFVTKQFDKFSGNVDIELISEDGSKPNLPIKANEVLMTWKAGRSIPVTISMRGNVDIEHPEAHIRAQRADWNLESGELVFTGNPVMNSESFKNVLADEIRINMETGALEMEGGRVREMSLQATDSGGGDAGGNGIPGLLSESDITDWAAFLDTIKEQANAEGENPGKQLLSRLGETPRNMLRETDTNTLVGAKGQILAQLNGVLKRPGMFKRSAWAGIPLTEEIERLLDIPDQTPEEQVRQNRLLLHVAYPELVKGL